MSETIYEATGKVHAKPPPRDGKYHSIVVQTEEGRYPQYVPFDVFDKLVPDVKALNVGDEVSVSFRLKGREWTNPKSGEVKYFGSATVVRIDLVRPAERGAQQTDAGRGGPPAATDDDQLPF